MEAMSIWQAFESMSKQRRGENKNDNLFHCRQHHNVLGIVRVNSWCAPNGIEGLARGVLEESVVQAVEGQIDDGPDRQKGHPPGKEEIRGLGRVPSTTAP